MIWKLLAALLLLHTTASATQEDDELAPTFSVTRGFYSAPFDLEITTKNQDPILYTLDGSDPRTSPRAQRATTPFLLRINPLDFSQRDRSPGVIVRAAHANRPLAKIATHTYLFVDRIRHLSTDGQAPGPLWAPPDNEGQRIDYGLDPEIINDARYSEQIEEAFLAIPTFSISTATENIFSREKGIYLNATKRGAAWERPASVELLYPNGDEGFQIDAGLRIRGGYSRNDFNPKHAFRLFFRSEYGDAKLKYPLFGDEGAQSFDKIDLRTSQNYAWSNGPNNGHLNIMNRDVFSRDTQRDMQRPYTRSNYYHLYLNGTYWGLFQTQERAEAAYAATYFGGERADYDVVKVDPANFRWVIEATDGDLASWRRVYELTQQGFESNTNYYRLQGKNSDGSRNRAYDVMVDIDNLIDYMLIIFYGGNFDAPVSKFLGNKKPNNFFAIYDRRGEAGFRFFVHDAEHTLLTATFAMSNGIEENRVHIGTLSGRERMAVDGFENFHPQWLHHRLSAHADYRARFAEHVQRHFFDGGALTQEALRTRFLHRASQIEKAIIAESARWGDAHVETPHTQRDWRRGIDHLLDNYFPLRGDIVLAQLRDADLYPTLHRASFSASNGPITQPVHNVTTETRIKIENPNTSGQIIYTLDGSDPRHADGHPSQTSRIATPTTSIAVQGTSVLKARILRGGETTRWSTLRQLTLEVETNFLDLRISEVHYNPLPSDDYASQDLEFIELYNAGSEPINLSFLSFSDGINYSFPAASSLAPGRFFVLAAHGRAFAQRYGKQPFGEFSGQLNNGGERLALSTASGDTILHFTYDDNKEWPDAADGEGFSLVLREGHTRDFSDAGQWHSSTNIHGSPGRGDADTAVGEFLAAPAHFTLAQNYPNPFNASTLIRFSLEQPAPTSLRVYDLLGQHITTLVDQNMPTGQHAFSWQPKNLSSGIYLYRLQTGASTATRKLLLLQ